MYFEFSWCFDAHVRQSSMLEKPLKIQGNCLRPLPGSSTAAAMNPPAENELAELDSETGDQHSIDHVNGVNGSVARSSAFKPVCSFLSFVDYYR